MGWFGGRGDDIVLTPWSAAGIVLWIGLCFFLMHELERPDQQIRTVEPPTYCLVVWYVPAGDRWQVVMGPNFDSGSPPEGTLTPPENAAVQSVIRVESEWLWTPGKRLFGQSVGSERKSYRRPLLARRTAATTSEPLVPGVDRHTATAVAAGLRSEVIARAAQVFPERDLGRTLAGEGDWVYTLSGRRLLGMLVLVALIAGVFLIPILSSVFGSGRRGSH